MVTGELGRTAVLQNNCIDDVAAETRHAPPPSWWRALCLATWVNYVVNSDTSGGTIRWGCRLSRPLAPSTSTREHTLRSNEPHTFAGPDHMPPTFMDQSV